MVNHFELILLVEHHLVTISEERQNYDHFDGNSISFKFINGFGYKIAPSPNNSARVNVAKPNLPTISISADTLSIIKGEYAGFTISSDQVLQSSLDVGIAVRQVGNVFSGEPQSTVQLAQGTQDKTLLIKTGGDEIDQIEESVLVEILPHPDYLVSTRSYLARTNVVEDDGEVSSDNILSINSLSSSHIYGSPVKFAINSSSLLSFDIMVKLEINMDGSIITEEVEFVRGQTNTVYTISPDRYLEVEEIQVKILESIDYTVAIEPNNMATTQIEKPTISIIDFNSSTSRVENGAYRFKIYSSAFVNTNLSINLQYQATFYPTKSFTSVINFNTFQKIIEIPQSEVPNARNFRIKVLTGAGYKVAESPDNQVEINFNIAGIKLSTNKKYVVRGEPIEFKMTANTSLSADTEVFLKLSDRFTGGESIMTFTETLEADQLTKSFYIEPEDYGSLSQIVVEILNAPDYPFSNYYRDSHWATAPKIVHIADIAKPGIVVTALQSSIKEGSGDAKFKISATPPPNADLEVITDIAYIYNHYPYRGTSSTQNLVIPAGISSVELSVPIPDDDISMDVYDLSVTARTNANYDTQYRFAHASIEVYDNDPPILNISYVDWRITEGELAQFAVYSGNILSKTIEINLRISEVGEFIAEHNIDSVTMDAGTDFAGFAVPTVDDDEFELDGEIFAEILPSDDYLIEEGYSIDWLQVNDNDGRDAGLEITAITDSIVEGGLARFSIYTKHYTSEERTVNLSVKSLDGEFLGSDFSRFVKIPSYWSWVTVAIPTEDDEIFELDGAVEVTLEAGEGYYVSDVFKSAHVIVFDNDAPEGLSMIPTVNSIQEGESAQFLVRTDSNQYQDKTVVVEISQIGDVLSRSVDTKTVLIPRGSNTGELNVGTVDDEIDELSGYVVATLSPNQGENIISTQNRAVVLVEDNDVPAISIFRVTESVEEGDDIRYSLKTDQPAANNVFIEIGLEQEGHYIEEFATSTTAMLNLGTTEVEVSIPTLDDEVNEHDGLLTVTLLEGHGYLIDPDFIANTSISIVDNDENPEVSIFADLESVEEGAEGLFTITADRVSMFDNEINFEITGASIDFVTGEIPTSLTIDAFARSASLNIPTFDDDIYGNEEEIEIILNSGDGYTVSDFANSALVTVVDNENPPHISVSANANEINEGEIASFVLSSNRDSASEFEISIELDVSPSDLIDPNIALYQTLTFVELTESLLYEVVTVNDLVEGDNGTITVTILPGPDYEIEDGTNQATIAIGDDDGSPEISITSNTPEITEGEPVVFQISSSNPVGSDRSININAQSNFRNLYAESASSAIILPAGETNIDLTIDAIDDDDFGADETIELSLLGGDDYRVLSENSSASIDVVDNDKPAGVSVVPIASEVNEGDLVEFLITTSSIPTSDLTIAVDIREVAGNYVSQTIPEEIIIAAGESNAVVTITTERDGEGKADGFILAKLVGGEDYVLAAENETAHVVVKNVDVPAITITGSGLITEGADAIFTISSSFVPSADIPIEIAIEESGRFLLESPPNTVILSAHSRESVLRLSTEDDDNIEQNGEILVTVIPNEGYVVADPTENRASIAVRDNDTVQISLSAENTRIVEGHQANLILTASNVPENDLIISLQAELIGDFEYSFSPVADLVDQVFQMTVPAGQRILQFQLDTVDDLILEPFGTATIALIADSEYLVDPLANQVEIDIFDNDEAAAEVYIFSHTESITEGESAIFSIRKSSSIVSNLAIDLSLADSSGDFLVSEQPQNVFLPLDELSTFIEIESIDDEVAELAGEIVVTIIPNADYTISPEYASASTTVLDNDDYTPVVSIIHNDPSMTYVVEGETVEFLVSLDKPVESGELNIPVIFEFTDIEGTSESPTVRELEFLANGPLSQLIELEISVDDEYQVGGSLFATIQAGEGYSIATNANRAVVDVVESLITSSTVQIYPNLESIQEGEDAVFRIERAPDDIDYSLEIEVNISETGEYIRGRRSDWLVFGVGQSLVTLAVPTLNDNVLETSGSISVEIVNSENYEVNQDFSNATILVHDDDKPVGVSILPVSATIFEGDIAQFQIFTQSPNENAQSVNLTIDQRGDFLANTQLPQAVAIESNSAVSNLNLHTIDDDVFEASGEISIEITEGEGYTTADSYNSASIIVFDNDPQPGLAITAINKTIVEGQLAQFQISSSVLLPTPRSVELSIVKSGDFFTNSIDVTSINIQPYNSNALYVVATDDDNIDELNGEIKVSLVQENNNFNNSRYQSATITIQDNDEPIISISSTLGQSDVEEGTLLSFELTADKEPVQDLLITVNVNATGDYLSQAISSIDKVITAGQLRTEFDLATKDNSYHELDGEVTLSIGAGSNYEIASEPNDSVSITILDDDQPPEVSITTESNSIEEGDSLQFNISTNTVSNVDLPVNLRIRKLTGNFLISEDSATETLPAFETSKLLEILTDDNEIAQSTIEYIAEIQPDSNYSLNSNASSASIFVADNDGQPVISIDAISESITEGESADFKIDISPISENTFEVGLLVEDGDSDFLASNQLRTTTIVSYTQEKLISIQTQNDESIEADGIITVQVQPSVNYLVNSSSGSANIAVIDNDTLPSISISTSDTSIDEGQVATFALTSSEVLTDEILVEVKISDGNFAFVDDSASWIVKLLANTSTVNLVVPTIDDDEFEADGFINARIFDGIGYRAASAPDDLAIVNVEDNDELAGISIIAINDTVTEGDLAEFKVISSEPVSRNMYISIRVNLGLSFDQQFVNRFAFIPIGETKGILSLATTNNESIDQDFVITATILENPEYSIASPLYQEATVTILDNDDENLIFQ